MEGTKVASVDVIRVDEYTPEVRLLSDAVDILASLAMLVASFSGEPPKIPGAPRPSTAAMRLADRRGDELLSELEADLAAAQARWIAEHPEEA